MKTDNLDPRVQKVIAAAVAYTEIAERCHAHHESRTKEMQRAVALARAGNQAEAKQILVRLDLGATVVFDFTDVQKDLIRACKPFRKADKTPTVSPAETTERQEVDEGAAIQEYNSYRDNKEAYLNKEHPEWMEKQYGKMCQKCGFRHFPRPECPGESEN